MPTEILAVDVTEASSSDQTVADGASLTLALKTTSGPIPQDARVRVEIKDDDDAYFGVGELTVQVPALVIAGPGVYRVTRIAGATCGVFSG